jgi:hypothetical protein
MNWIRPAIAITLLVVPIISGVLFWFRSKGTGGGLVLTLLGTLLLGAVLAGAYVMFDIWLVTRKQGHF